MRFMAYKKFSSIVACLQIISSTATIFNIHNCWTNIFPEIKIGIMSQVDHILYWCRIAMCILLYFLVESMASMWKRNNLWWVIPNLLTASFSPNCSTWLRVTTRTWKLVKEFCWNCIPLSQWHTATIQSIWNIVEQLETTFCRLSFFIVL